MFGVSGWVDLIKMILAYSDIKIIKEILIDFTFYKELEKSMGENR